jgi:purine-binding chemotaxis protein CheW
VSGGDFHGPPEGSWATFNLGDETFAIAAEHVHEILTSEPLTPVPLAPHHILGLLNLRGQVMPAIDLGRRLGIAASSNRRRPSLIVLKNPEGLVAILVDAIGDVMDLAAGSWRPVPETLGGHQRTCLFGICPLEGRMLLGLRVEAIDPAPEGNPSGVRT